MMSARAISAIVRAPAAKRKPRRAPGCGQRSGFGIVAPMCVRLIAIAALGALTLSACGGGVATPGKTDAAADSIAAHDSSSSDQGTGRDGQVLDTSGSDLAGGDAPPATDSSVLDGPHDSGGQQDSGGQHDTGPTVVPGIFVTVTHGSFQMGSLTGEPCRQPWSVPEDPHNVTLTHDFKIQDTEVTQAQFQDVMGYNPSYYATCGSDCPVEMVSWFEAAGYCNRLSEIAGTAKCYSCSTPPGPSMTCTYATDYQSNIYACPGYRLPTEAEWEFAYRGGSLSALYNGALDGDDCSGCDVSTNATAIAWYCSNSAVGGVKQPHPVRGKVANSLVLFDMAGNVAEYTNDWRDTVGLGTGDQTNPMGPASTLINEKVRRGGSHISPGPQLRAANREGWGPDAPASTTGFRPARSLN
jgi:formylglycine-generating enzyme required for sulfatase activity